MVFMDCWAEYERITAPAVEQVSGIFKTVAVKGMQVEVVVERHGQYNKAFDMQPQAGKEVSHAQQGSGGGGEYSPRQMVAGKSSEKTDTLRLDLEMEGNIKEESV